MCINPKSCSHQPKAKANAKAKKIKGQAKEIKEKIQTLKKIFAFASAFTRCEWSLTIEAFCYRDQFAKYKRVMTSCNSKVGISLDKGLESLDLSLLIQESNITV